MQRINCEKPCDDPFKEGTPVDAKISTFTPGSTTYDWLVGDLGKNTLKSNTVSTKVTICGNEKLTAKSPGAVINLGTDTLDIPKAVLDTYFVLDASAEGASSGCKIQKYEVTLNAG